MHVKVASFCVRTLSSDLSATEAQESALWYEKNYCIK